MVALDQPPDGYFSSINAGSRPQPDCASFEFAGRDKIELLLSLGATRWEASKETVARCVRLALTPILNQMNVVVNMQNKCSFRFHNACCAESAVRQFRHCRERQSGSHLTDSCARR